MHKNGNTLKNNVVATRTDGGLASRKPLLLPGHPDDDRQTTPFTKWRRWHAISTLSDWLDILATCEYNFSRADDQELDKTCSYIKNTYPAYPGGISSDNSVKQWKM